MLRLLALASLVLIAGDQARFRVVPNAALASLPLLTSSDFSMDGGFRVPFTCGSWTFEFSPMRIALNHATGTMYATVRQGIDGVAEISVPSAVVSSATVGDLPTATCLQGIVDPIEGKNDEADNGANPGASLSSLLVWNGRLIGGLSMFYDANDDQRKVFYSRPLTLATTGNVLGLTRFWDGLGTGNPIAPGGAGYLSGWLAHIPTEWRASLGGYPVAAGQCCQSIITRNSYGPAAFGINPALIGQAGEPHPAQPFVYYSAAHQTLGAWDAVSQYYDASTVIRGLVLVNGTRTALFFGRRGTTYCYGDGTSNPALHMEPLPGFPDQHYCYDPTSADKGQHGYPYFYRVWAYNLQHWAEVVAGTRAPWLVEPYSAWDLTFPITLPSTRELFITGADYDPATKKLYLVQSFADPGGFKEGGVVWRLSMTRAGVP